MSSALSGPYPLEVRENKKCFKSLVYLWVPGARSCWTSSLSAFRTWSLSLHKSLMPSLSELCAWKSFAKGKHTTLRTVSISHNLHKWLLWRVNHCNIGTRNPQSSCALLRLKNSLPSLEWSIAGKPWDLQWDYGFLKLKQIKISERNGPKLKDCKHLKKVQCVQFCLSMRSSMCIICGATTFQSDSSSQD